MRTSQALQERGKRGRGKTSASGMSCTACGSIMDASSAFCACGAQFCSFCDSAFKADPTRQCPSCGAPGHTLTPFVLFVLFPLNSLFYTYFVVCLDSSLFCFTGHHQENNREKLRQLARDSLLLRLNLLVCEGQQEVAEVEASKEFQLVAVIIVASLDLLAVVWVQDQSHHRLKFQLRSLKEGRNW